MRAHDSIVVHLVHVRQHNHIVLHPVIFYQSGYEIGGGSCDRKSQLRLLPTIVTWLSKQYEALNLS
jgi:hypothetical protein